MSKISSIIEGLAKKGYSVCESVCSDKMSNNDVKELSKSIHIVDSITNKLPSGRDGLISKIGNFWVSLSICKDTETSEDLLFILVCYIDNSRYGEGYIKFPNDKNNEMRAIKVFNKLVSDLSSGLDMKRVLNSAGVVLVNFDYSMFDPNYTEVVSGNTNKRLIPEKKDMQRAEDMLENGDGSNYKSLASKMAKLIKDKDKMVRRYKAITYTFYKRFRGYSIYSEVTKAFEDVMLSMGFSIKELMDIKTNAEKGIF